MLSGPLWAVLGCSWGLCGWSWAALGASVGGPGGPLGHMLAVLGAPWGLCGRSRAILEASVGGPGLLLGPLWPVLGRIKPKSGPSPSEETIWQADQGGEVAQTRAGRQSRGGAGTTLFAHCFLKILVAL